MSNSYEDTTFRKAITFADIKSRIIHGDAAKVLKKYPIDTAQLIFTSPPYFNAKPDCYKTESYDNYLHMLKAVFVQCHRVLSEGRFLVVNTSPILIQREKRNLSSRRIPITFDIHPIITKCGFEFIDDIVWLKPEGVGWQSGRGRRFAADKQPLQYKTVPVTENIIVYRKNTNKLIDWNIKNHPDKLRAALSKVPDNYERTNVWNIKPAMHEKHPAVFPEELADKIIRYYSFINDMILDPFSGSGTVARIASRLDRRFMMIEKKYEYFYIQKTDYELMSNNPEVIMNK